MTVSRLRLVLLSVSVLVLIVSLMISAGFLAFRRGLLFVFLIVGAGSASSLRGSCGRSRAGVRRCPLFVGGLAACSGLGVMVSAGVLWAVFLFSRVGFSFRFCGVSLVWVVCGIGSAAFVAYGAFVCGCGVWCWRGVVCGSCSRCRCFPAVLLYIQNSGVNVIYYLGKCDLLQELVEWLCSI